MEHEAGVEAGMTLLGINDDLFLRCVGLWGFANEPILVLQCAEALRNQGAARLGDRQVTELGAAIISRWSHDWECPEDMIPPGGDPRAALQSLLERDAPPGPDDGFGRLLWSVGALRSRFHA